MVSSPSLLLQNSLSLSLYGLTSTPHTLSLSLSLFLFSPRKFVIRIGDSQCTVGSSDLCLLISFEIKGESALNLFRSLSIFFFFLWISEFATFCLVFFCLGLSDSSAIQKCGSIFCLVLEKTEENEKKKNETF